jgi:hypothetical protein
MKLKTYNYNTKGYKNLNVNSTVIHIKKGNRLIIEDSNGKEILHNNIKKTQRMYKYDINNKNEYTYKYIIKLECNGTVLKDFEKYITLNYFQYIKYTWIMNNNWFQSEGNIRWLMNIILVISGLIFTGISLCK